MSGGGVTMGGGAAEGEGVGRVSRTEAQEMIIINEDGGCPRAESHRMNQPSISINETSSTSRCTHEYLLRLYPVKSKKADAKWLWVRREVHASVSSSWGVRCLNELISNRTSRLSSNLAPCFLYLATFFVVSVAGVTYRQEGVEIKMRGFARRAGWAGEHTREQDRRSDTPLLHGRARMRKLLSEGCPQA
eukprot:750691-Hanusia_phi.AAC.2